MLTQEFSTTFVYNIISIRIGTTIRWIKDLLINNQKDWLIKRSINQSIRSIIKNNLPRQYPLNIHQQRWESYSICGKFYGAGSGSITFEKDQ